MYPAIGSQLLDHLLTSSAPKREQSQGPGLIRGTGMASLLNLQVCDSGDKACLHGDETAMGRHIPADDPLEMVCIAQYC